MRSRQLLAVLFGILVGRLAIAQDQPAATLQPIAPDTITLRTGGGDSIEKRPVDLFRKTQWRFSYPDAPPIEQSVNAVLQSAGYDVAEGKRIGWHVQTIYLGTPEQYVPYTPKKGIGAGTVERILRGAVGTVAAVAAPMPTVFRANLGASIMTGQTYQWRNATPLTDDMLEGLPLGAKRVLVTRVLNPFYRATQDVMTVAYSDVSDEELRWLNARHVFELIELKVPITKTLPETRNANDVCPSAWAFYTGKKPQQVKPVLATVAEIKEVQLVLGNTPTSSGEKEGVAQADLPAGDQEAVAPSVPVLQIDYRPEGSDEPRSLLRPRELTPAIAPGDRIQITESLFSTQVVKAKTRN